MTQMPPPPTVTYAPPQPRPANGWAIASLVCGIIGCLFVTPFAAIITGFVGLTKARRLGGRGMAITGIILGILWIVAGVGVAGAGYFGVKYVIGEAKVKTVDAINALANDDFSQAKALVNISDEDAATLSAKFKAYGKCTDISVGGFESKTVNGSKATALHGTLKFVNAGEKNFSAALSNDSGKLKIDELWVD